MFLLEKGFCIYLGTPYLGHPKQYRYYVLTDHPVYYPKSEILHKYIKVSLLRASTTMLAFNIYGIPSDPGYTQ